MKLPNMYVDVGETSTIDLAFYFDNGRNLSYTASSADARIAEVAVSGTKLTVRGVSVGAVKLTVKPSAGQEQTLIATVRKNAGESGWM